MAKIIRQRAEPTLRGLRLLPAQDDPSAESVIHPWDRVARTTTQQTSFWRIVNEDGSPLLEGGRRVSPRLDKRSDRLAWRAQVRWFRREWSEGRLCIEDRYASLPWGCSLALLLVFISGLAMVLGRTWSGFGRFLHALSGLPLSRLFNIPPSKMIVLCIMIAASLLFSLFLLYGTYILIRAAWPRKILWSRIDCKGIRVHMRGGSDAFAAWEDVDDIRPSGLGLRLWFRDGRRVEIVEPPPRTRLVIQIIREERWPERVASAGQALRALLLRVVVFWMVMLAGLVATVYVRCLRDSRPMPWWPLVSLAFMPFVLIGLLVLRRRLQSLLERRRVQRLRQRRREIPERLEK